MGNALKPVSNTLPVALEADAEAARDFARESLSPATRRAYRTDIRAFETWCGERRVRAIPAAPEVVASFLAHEAQRGLAVSSISRRAAAIRLFHRSAGHATPTESEVVRSTLRGIRRTLGVAPKQKKPLTSELLLSLLEHIPDSLRGKRDRALLLLGFAGAFRRSTLAMIEVEDLEEVADGLRVQVRRSKTDQEGQGAVVPIVRGRKACPVEAVNDWMASRTPRKIDLRRWARFSRRLPSQCEAWSWRFRGPRCAPNSRSTRRAGLECTEARSCRLDRGARGRWAEGSASGRESIVVLQAAKNK